MIGRCLLWAVLAFVCGESVEAQSVYSRYSGAVTVPLASPPDWQWCPLAIGGGGNNLGLTIDPSNSSRAYIRCDVSGVIRTEDSGGHWRNVNDGFHGEAQGNYSIGAIGVDPSSPNRVYAALARQYSAGGGVFRSDDYGDSWTKISDDIGLFATGGPLARGDGGAGLLVSPSNGSWLTSINLDISRGPLGAWMSWDSGVTWSPSLSSRAVNTLAWIPGTPDAIMAGCVARNSYAGGLFRSTDYGATWSAAGLSAYSVYEFAFGSADGQTIYASVGSSGIAKTTNGGASWSLINTGLPTSSASTTSWPFYPYEYHTISVDPTNASHLLTAGWAVNSIYESTNAGASWTSHVPSAVNVPSGWMNPPSNFAWHTNHITFAPGSATKRYLSDIWGTWTTSDGGVSWDLAPYGQETSCCTDIVADPAISGRLYIGLFDHAMLLYQDSATTPSAPHPSGLVGTHGSVNLHTSGIAQNLLSPSKLVIVTNSTFVQYSTDNGASFSEATTGLPSSSARSGFVGQPLIASPAGKSLLMLNGTAAAGGGLYVSTDSGATWSHAANSGLPNVSITSAWGALLNRWTCSPWAGVIAMVTGGNIYHSTDFGANWTSYTPPSPATAIAYGSGYLVVGTQNGVYKVNDHMAGSYTHCTGPTGSVETIAVDPNNLSRWLVHTITGTGSDGSPIQYALWLTENGGSTWTSLLNETAAIWRLRGLAFDPFNANRIFANTYWGGSWMALRPGSY